MCCTSDYNTKDYEEVLTVLCWRSTNKEVDYYDESHKSHHYETY